MRKDYYYVDAEGNRCELSTANPDHQIKIEAHILKHGESPKMKDKTKIKTKKRVLKDGKIVEQDQDFLIVLEPFLADEVE